MYEFTVTSTADGCLVSYQILSAAEAERVLGNLHIARIQQLGCTLIVETTGGAFRYFFDCK